MTARLTSGTCPLCLRNQPPVESRWHGIRDAYWIDCPSCSKFGVTGTALHEIASLSELTRADISCWLADRAAQGLPTLTLCSSGWTSTPGLQDAISISEAIETHCRSDIVGRFDRMLIALAKRSPFAGALVTVGSDQRFEFSCRTASELQFVIRTLKERGLIFIDSERNPTPIGLTAAGWERVDALERPSGTSAQAFVAMSFNTKLEAAWLNGLKPGIVDARYQPMRVDKKEHNEKICDRIVAEIRRSHFVVADVTRQRQGVYFEAGLALGMGLPVIWTCRSDEIGRCHFDTRQYNHVLWSSPEELRTKLCLRIEATIPRAD